MGKLPRAHTRPGHGKLRLGGSADERDLPKCRRHAIARARSAGVT